MNEEEIFHQALARSLPEERAAYLEQACTGNPALRASVGALLRANVGASGFLDRPAPGLVAIDHEPSVSERPGTAIGPYKLLEQIGEGGFGVVFMAEQQQPVRRKVALKVLKPGMDTKQVVTRFEAERQALALMDHPHIAHVLDAGTTDSGRPYFVMELIPGIPITGFCDDNRLTPRERLELFLAVCQAMQHAHQKGIIHRDLKPSNVLVTQHDGKPMVKVIDFGIAKALGPERLTDKTLCTGFAQMIGTPLYMSPEQAEMSRQDADTRTDIYSLGVLLYELLTGTTPFDKERLKEASYEELRRILREEEPLKPSTRISTLGQAATTVSANRKCEPKRLGQLFRGELDWIVMKALEKDRNRRYDTASAFAADVQHYLHDEPIQARPIVAAERMIRWCRRNPGLAGALGAAALFLLLGTVISSLFGVHALAAAKQADQEATNARAQAQRADREAGIAREAKMWSDRRYYASEMKLASLEAEAGQMSLVQQRLQEHEPQGAKDPDPRGFEWYYLQRLCQLDLRTLQGYTGGVECVAFSPNGHRIAAAGFDRTDKVLPDGSLSSVLGNATVKVWDAATGQECLTLKGHTSYVAGVAFSPDGRRLASASHDRTVKLWDAATGKECMTLKGHTGWVYAVAFSPDGRRLASTGDGTVRIWDTATGKDLLTIKGHTAGLCGVTFSPDGRRLATGGDDQTVKVWDAATGQECLTLKGHTDRVFGVAFSPDGRRLASASQDKIVKVWDAVTGQECLTLRGHTDMVFGVAYSPDGRRLASASQDKIVKVWDAVTGQECLTLKGHIFAVKGVAFSPDGRRLASASLDKTVKLWDAATSQECLTLTGHTSLLYCVAFSPDGVRLASASQDGTVKVWEAATGRNLLSLKGHTGSVCGVAFSPDGRHLASAGEPGTVKVRDAATGQECLTLKGPGTVMGVAYSPDSRRLALASGWTVKVWDTATGQDLLTLKGHTQQVWGVAYSPDGRRLASASQDQTVKVWDAATGQDLLTLKGHTEGVHGVAYSPDGRRLASASWDQTVKVWDAVTGQNLLTLKGHTSMVFGVAYSPDGRRLASASYDQTVKVWDAAIGQEYLTLKGHTDQVRCVAFSPDGRRLASASQDETVKIWDATALTPQRQIEREARSLVQFLFAKSLSPEEGAAAIRRDPTITEAVRQQALAWVESFWRGQAR